MAHLLWFMGIHGALIITGVLSPFWMANLAANQSGPGGWRAVTAYFPARILGLFPADWRHRWHPLPLVWMALRSRSRTLKSVGKLGLLRLAVQYHEPLLFGFPIIMNPLFFCRLLRCRC